MEVPGPWLPPSVPLLSRTLGKGSGGEGGAGVSSVRPSGELELEVERERERGRCLARPSSPSDRRGGVAVALSGHTGLMGSL